MRPEEALERAVRVSLLIRKLMVTAVDRDPIRRRFHHAAGSQQYQGALQPPGKGGAAMRHRAMEADEKAGGAKDVHAERDEKTAGPAEEPGHESQQGQQVKPDAPAGVVPVYPPWAIRF